MLNVSDDHLHMTLRLHEAPHHPKRAEEAPSQGICEHGRDYSVVWPLLWAYAVHMSGIQREIITSVLQGKEIKKKKDIK